MAFEILQRCSAFNPNKDPEDEKKTHTPQHTPAALCTTQAFYATAADTNTQTASTAPHKLELVSLCHSKNLGPLAVSDLEKGKPHFEVYAKTPAT